MVRRSFYITLNQVNFLGNLSNITISEHVRRALDEYIDKLREDKSSASLSKKKVGDSDA